MAEFQIAWNPTTRVAMAQAKGSPPFPGSTIIAGDEEHSEVDDELGYYPKSHTLYHHVQNALYRQTPPVTDMQRVKIMADIAIHLIDFNSTPAVNRIAPGATVQLVNVFNPVNILDKRVTYQTSDAAKATVSPTGLVTGVAVGQATITVTHTETGKTDTVAVNVAVAVVSISSTPPTASLAPAATQQITTAFTPSNATDQGLTYATSDPAIATVSPSGLITAVAVGTATITVTSLDGAKTDTVVVTVA